MDFIEGKLYHIYNQGNDRMHIFYKQINYDYFLRKLRKYMLPHVDILAWCLMPNHFHFMVLVKKLEVPVSLTLNNSKDTGQTIKKRTLNHSIGIMLRSYTRGINKQEQRSGSLFRNNTKAVEINQLKSIIPTIYATNSTRLLEHVFTERQYAQICFNYIHLNPVRAKMVDKPFKYEYSSAREYLSMELDKLINIERAKEYVDISTVKG